MTGLLERDELLAALTAALASAARGAGATVLVSGEAGIGKTTLLEHFAQSVRNARVLWGGCEALSTPHPLGPLHDLAHQAGERLRSHLAAGHDRAALFAAVLEEAARPPSPTVIVLEDVHWADAATLDLVKFLGRRIHREPAMLILSHRDDEGSLAALRPTLAALPPAHVIRLAVPPLSQAAVEGMAATAQRDVRGLYAATGGNAFFVTEVLKHGAATQGVPATVRDAVLGRAAHLDPGALEVLQLAAIVPRSIPLRLVHDVLAPSTEAIEQCVMSGLLLAEGDSLRFRHELARTAVEEATLRPRAMQWHARVLAVLSARPAGTVPLAQLVHHAQLAGDAEAVLRLAPQAAREAALHGSRVEAVAHLRGALAHANALPDHARATLLDDYATHCFEVNDLPCAIASREEAIELYGRAGEIERQIEALASHALALVRSLRNAEADEVSRRAIALAEQLPSGHPLAKACAIESYLRMLNRDYRDAIAWGDKAIVLAQRHGYPEILASAHNTMGAAMLFVDYPHGLDCVKESQQIAQTLNDGGVGVADAYVMLGSGSGEVYEFANADRFLAEGIAYARARDLDRVAGYMEAWQALCDLYQGRWDLAGPRANAVTKRETGDTTNRVVALVALGRLRTRRGDPGIAEVLDEALALATRSGTLQRLAPVCCARAEAAWLEGRDERVKAEAQRAFDLALKKGHPWFVGELAYWLWRIDALREMPPGCAEPYALQMSGRWQDAAAAWERIGCPYEQARALADGDEAAQRAALAILDRLGARPLAERIRQQMRSAGVRSVPRGPLAATRSNTAGLTARELEVLALLAEGSRNAEIASRLSRSLRTVDHHVEAILAKLDVATRGEAVAAARRLGLLKNG
jgi:DNA-binding CsgD family transcriptional regulator